MRLILALLVISLHQSDCWRKKTIKELTRDVPGFDARRIFSKEWLDPVLVECQYRFRRSVFNCSDKSDVVNSMREGVPNELAGTPEGGYILALSTFGLVHRVVTECQAHPDWRCGCAACPLHYARKCEDGDDWRNSSALTDHCDPKLRHPIYVLDRFVDSYLATIDDIQLATLMNTSIQIGRKHALKMVRGGRDILEITVSPALEDASFPCPVHQLCFWDVDACRDACYSKFLAHEFANVANHIFQAYQDSVLGTPTNDSLPLWVNERGREINQKHIVYREQLAPACPRILGRECVGDERMRQDYLSPPDVIACDQLCHLCNFTTHQFNKDVDCNCRWDHENVGVICDICESTVTRCV